MNKQEFSNKLVELSRAFPQLLLPTEEGVSKSEEYKNVVLRGMPCDRALDFVGSDSDYYEIVNTPAGEVKAISFGNRKDFIHAYRCIGYKCEPVEVADSIGAVIISGINNWDKVRSLTKPISEVDKSEYKDVLILLSRGPYSNVSHDTLNLEENVWLDKSYLIRKNHELTHFISRKLFIENKDAIRDEILADMTGLLFAFGEYDEHTAKTIIGFKNDEYQSGGRLENYIEENEGEDTLQHATQKALRLIKEFSEKLPEWALDRPFDVVLEFEKNRVGIN